MLTLEQMNAIVDKMEGWEIVEFLQVSAQDILVAALDNGWINEDSASELLGDVGLDYGEEDDD